MRDPLYWLPIKYKLPLTFGFICLTAFGVGGYVVAFVARRALERQILMRLDEYSKTTTIMVDRQLELLGRRVEDFASDGFVRTQLTELIAPRADRVPGTEGRTRARLLRHLVENKLPLVDEFVAMFLLGREGAPVLQTHAGWTPTPASYTTNELWFGPLKAPTEEHPYLSFVLSAPVHSLDGKRQLGFLQILVRADTWIARQRGKGVLPYSSPFQIWLTDDKGHALLLASESMEGPHRDEVSAGMGEGASVIAYTTTIPRNGWQIKLQVDRSRAMEPINNLRMKFLLTGGVLLSLVLAMLFFPAWFLVRPLGQLRDAARRIAEGDLSAQVNVDSRDEIGDLARSFNIMTNAIGERTHKLEEAAVVLKRRETEIRMERDRLDMVIHSMQDGLFILDREGNIPLSNRAAQPVVSALTRENNPLSRRPECHTTDGKTQGCLECLREVNTPSHFCQVHVDSRVYEIHGTMLPAADGSAGDQLFVARDITERMIQAERQGQQERMAVLGQVAAVMAHELNNPLAAIAMFSQMLESSLEPGSSHQESADVIRRNAETCKETIRMLLDTTASAAPEFSEFDVDELLKDIQRFLRPLYQRVDASLHVESAAKDAAIVGDKLQLRQVIVNLLMNALQAGEGRGVHVHVVTEDRGEELAILVSDTGPGIAPAIREHIFKPFFTTKPPGVGTGLGLPTSRRIIEVHGGTLELIDSKPGNTVFQIVLPHRGRQKLNSEVNDTSHDRVGANRISDEGGAHLG